MSVTFKREVGAELRGDQCYFKVWAPDAEAVYPVFEKNGWTKVESHKLNLSADGYWEGVVGEIQENDHYKFLIIPKGVTGTIDEKAYLKLDPAARDVVDDYLKDRSNAGLFIKPTYNWARFDTPQFENFIIYQLHVGTFAGYNDDFSAEVSQLPDQVAQFKHTEAKLGYISQMGFDAIELLPVQEFPKKSNWGYEPSFYFAPESAYGTPEELKHLVNEAHKHGLAVIFDVVFNHMTGTSENNPMYNYDLDNKQIYMSDFEYSGGKMLAIWNQKVKDLFFDNLKMYFDVYNADGIRVDMTTEIAKNRGWDNDGWKFLQYLTWMIKDKYPNKYLIAEHLDDNDQIVQDAGFHATWCVWPHHRMQRALDYEFHPERCGHPIDELKSVIGKDRGYGHNYYNQWNLVRYILGSHDECGDLYEDSWKKENIDEVHKYFTEFFGGRGEKYARAKARLAWALNVASMGNPMLFMGSEYHAPYLWNNHRHDGFNWQLAGDDIGMPMRRMVEAVNKVRWSHYALRSEMLQVVHEDYDNKILAFKRWVPGANDVVLVVVNMGNRAFSNYDYNVKTGGQKGQWDQIFCSQDFDYGGRHGAGNAFHKPETFEFAGDYFINLNVPEFSVVMMWLEKYRA